MKSPVWWRKPFESVFCAEHLGPVQKTDKLTKEVRAEWTRITNRFPKARPVLSADWDKAWASLVLLLEGLKGDRDIAPNVVAQAYCALVDALEITGAERGVTLAAASD